jgi:uncharacterized membrane protein YedE/YeeE
MANFTPWSALGGGLLIGVSVVALWIVLGRVAGISGIVGQLLRPTRGDSGWRLAFVAGLVGGGALMHVVAPSTFPAAAPGSLGLLAVAGVLVGFGTRLGGGCTSGHGLCGVSRLSTRSLVATGVFMALGMAVVWVARHLFGGAA